MPSSPTRQVSELFANLTRSQAELTLDDKDLCFLVALQFSLESTGETTLSESTLRDIFERTWQHVEPDAANPQKAATERIDKLRRQRLLNRLSPTRYAADSDYALSTLAHAIITFFYEDERLTRETLDVLSATVAYELTAVRQALERGPSEDYHSKVIQPLRVSVVTLIEGIVKRQQGLDRKQEDLRREIAAALPGASESVVEKCCEHLEEMASVLRELNGVLMEGATRLGEIVEEICQQARILERQDIFSAAADVASKINRMANWGQSRLDNWTEYHEQIHRHIRTVISLDPNRALTHALRDLMVRGPTWSLRVCQPDRYLWLQEPKLTTSRTPITCASKGKRKIDEVEATPAVSPIERLVLAALQIGPVRYISLAREVLAVTSKARQFDALGELARHLGRVGIVRQPRDRDWTTLDRYEVQDWEVRSR